MRRGLALFWLALVSCTEAAPSPPAPTSAAPSATAALAPVVETPKIDNVLLISIDALRADMPWNGYPRVIAPKLEAFAKQSVVYTHAYALSSYTSMSLGGLMTGRYPSELPRNGLATSTFGEEATFLAEVLKAGGVRTIAVHGHVYFQGATGMNQGFDDWRVLPKITLMPAREGYVVDDKLADTMIAALGEHAKERFFAWVHFMDPHFSYAKHEGFPAFTGAPEKPVPPGIALGAVGQSLRNQYDGEVVFTDSQVGRLLEWLDQQPFGKRTAVIVTADHGEAFGEQKSTFEHGYMLWEVLTRVPLLVRLPGSAARRIDTRRSHIDLAKTILELLQLEPTVSMRGTSLVPELRGATVPARAVVMDMPYTDQAPRRRALIQSDEKIIVTETEEEPLVFDLKSDPAEQKTLARDDRERTQRLLRSYDEMNRALPDFPAPRRGKRQY
jgi:choline-sulfatase